MSTTGLVMTVTDELLAELEAIAQLATPGPWVARIEQDSPSFQGYYVSNYGVDMYASLGTSNQDEIDASFIAAANPATITALTAELRRLRAENAELAKDAGRYRWLRLSNGGKQRRAFIDADTTLRFDEAVDTFMAAQ